MARTIREMLEEQEAQTLHPRAAFSARSAGRSQPDPEDDDIDASIEVAARLVDYITAIEPYRR